MDWILTESRHTKALLDPGALAGKLLFADELSDSLRARLAAFSNLRCLAIGPGVDAKALADLDQDLIASTVTALGVFTSRAPANWPAGVCLPKVSDLLSALPELPSAEQIKALNDVRQPLNSALTDIDNLPKSTSPMRPHAQAGIGRRVCSGANRRSSA